MIAAHHVVYMKFFIPLISFATKPIYNCILPEWSIWKLVFLKLFYRNPSEWFRVVPNLIWIQLNDILKICKVIFNGTSSINDCSFKPRIPLTLYLRLTGPFCKVPVFKIFVKLFCPRCYLHLLKSQIKLRTVQQAPYETLYPKLPISYVSVLCPTILFFL